MFCFVFFVIILVYKNRVSLCFWTIWFRYREYLCILISAWLRWFWVCPLVYIWRGRIRSRNVWMEVVILVGMISLVMGLEVLILFYGYCTCSTRILFITSLWFYIGNIEGSSLNFLGPCQNLHFWWWAFLLKVVQEGNSEAFWVD